MNHLNLHVAKSTYYDLKWRVFRQNKREEINRQFLLEEDIRNEENKFLSNLRDFREEEKQRILLEKAHLVKSQNEYMKDYRKQLNNIEHSTEESANSEEASSLEKSRKWDNSIEDFKVKKDIEYYENEAYYLLRELNG